MKNFLLLGQMLVAIPLVTLILIQAQGTGLGRAWGGSGNYHSRKGLEKYMFGSTIGLVVIFVVLAIIGLVI